MSSAPSGVDPRPLSLWGGRICASAAFLACFAAAAVAGFVLQLRLYGEGALGADVVARLASSWGRTLRPT